MNGIYFWSAQGEGFGKLAYRLLTPEGSFTRIEASGRITARFSFLFLDDSEVVCVVVSQALERYSLLLAISHP